MNIVYEYRPNRATKREIALIALFFGAAVGFFLVPSLFKDMQIAWLFQSSALVCFGIAIFIYTNFLSKSFVYSISEDDDGKMFFVVSELLNGGKRSMMVCCVSLDCVEEVKVFDNTSRNDSLRKKEFMAKAKKEKRRRFSFYPEIVPNESCAVLIEQNDEKMLVNIVPDKFLVEKLIEATEKRVDTDTSV